MSLTKKTFHTWCPDMGEGETDSRPFEEYSYQDAAEALVKHLCRSEPMDDEDTVDVMVRGPSGATYRITVFCSYSINYRAGRTVAV